MNGVTYTVPVEAVRASVTRDGAVTLARLAALAAELKPDALVEHVPTRGWVATVVYMRPGFPSRVQHAHVALEWSPRLEGQP